MIKTSCVNNHACATYLNNVKENRTEYSANLITCGGLKFLNSKQSSHSFYKSTLSGLLVDWYKIIQSNSVEQHEGGCGCGRLIEVTFGTLTTGH